jgi:hypothetical protein
MNASISNAAPTAPGRGSAPPTRVQATVAALGRIGLDRYHVLAALGLLAVFLLYRFHIGAYLINDDEEGYLYAAWRISAGQVPYRDFITPQLPVFLYPGALLIALFGRSTELLRTESAALAVLAGGFTYLAGRRLFGPLAGLTAIALLLLQSDIFRVARAFRPEASMLMPTSHSAAGAT